MLFLKDTYASMKMSIFLNNVKSQFIYFTNKI